MGKGNNKRNSNEPQGASTGTQDPLDGTPLKTREEATFNKKMAELDEKSAKLDEAQVQVDAKLEELDKEGERSESPEGQTLAGSVDEQRDNQLYEIEIFKTESETAPVDVCVNGRNIRILRGHKVVVEKRFYEALMNSNIETFTQTAGLGDGEKPVIEAVKMARYPMSATRLPLDYKKVKG